MTADYMDVRRWGPLGEPTVYVTCSRGHKHRRDDEDGCHRCYQDFTCRACDEQVDPDHRGEPDLDHEGKCLTCRSVVCPSCGLRALDPHGGECWECGHVPQDGDDA